MTLGDGIFSSTLLIVFIFALYLIFKHRKWKLVGKIFGVFILIGALIGAGTWGWFAYQNRPQVAEEFAGFKLGMRPVDITLAIGEPDVRQEPIQTEGGQYAMSWTHKDGDYDRSLGAWLYFWGDSPESMTLGRICLFSGYKKLNGIDLSDSEDDVLEKLGEPEVISIQAEGIRKIVGYKELKTSFEIQAGEVMFMCAGSIPKFVDEYGEEPESDT